jgi:hypothetical protein
MVNPLAYRRAIGPKRRSGAAERLKVVRLGFVRLGFACSAATFGALFVFLYDSHQVHYAKFQSLPLPTVTHYCNLAVKPALVFPVLVLVLGLMAHRYRARTTLEIVIQAAWLFGLAWPLTVLFLWQFAWGVR